MKDLSQHIEYLLLSHDCVIYPQLGAFVTKYVPSRWSCEEDLFLPPFRSVCFNGELKEGDNLFVTTLSKRYRVTQDDAGLMCAEYLEHIHQELTENGTMDLGSIGVFIQENPSDALTFVPNEAGVTSPELYGLDALPFAPLADAAETAQKTGRSKKSAGEKNDDNHITIRISRHLVNYVAAAAASIVLFFALSTPVQNMQTADGGQLRSELFMPSNLMPVAAQTNSARCEATEVPQQAEEQPAVAEAEVPATEPTGYAVVLASQVSMKNAEAFVARLRADGYPAMVYTKGMVRVIIPGFATAEEVHAKIREMKAQSSKYKSAWTLKLE